MKIAIARFIVHAVSPVSFLVNGAIVVARFWRRRDGLRGADNVLILPEGGFGHTIMQPDAMRRAFKGQSNFVVLFYVKEQMANEKRHNPLVQEMWPDIQFELIRMWIGKPCPFALTSIQVRRALAWFFVAVLRIVKPKGRILYHDELLDALPGAEFVTDSYRHSSFTTRYHLLCRNVDAPPLHLPEARRQPIVERLAETQPRGLTRTAGLYLREKGLPFGQDILASVRTGSALEAYLPAVRELNREGYRVLVFGDRALPDNVRAEFGNALVDFQSLGVDSRAFMLFAASEADVMVGDTGGGSWLPAVNGIPYLMVNVFPYFVVQLGTTLVYKRLKNPDGTYVAVDDLFGRHTFDFLHEGFELENNDSELILKALNEFLDFVDFKNVPEFAPTLRDKFPRSAPAWTTPARVSPVWLGLYGLDADGLPVGSAKGLGRIPSGAEPATPAAERE